MAKIACAMSGGVDSSVTAALLIEGGHEVFGFTLKLHESPGCGSDTHMADAKRVADHLGIGHEAIDARAEFASLVVDPFVSQYLAGKTPNPCVTCNRTIKFGLLRKIAAQKGFDFLATGHYARLEGEAGARKLLKASFYPKDQSYFLAPREAGVFDNVLFPLGGLKKSEVREIAAQKELPVAQKGESQDICFVQNGQLAGFLAGKMPESRPGKIVDTSGRVLGGHRGVEFFTVGQRRGLGIAYSEPLYVIAIDAESSTVTVGARGEAFHSGLTATDSFFTRETPEIFRSSVKIRSTAAEVPCEVRREGANVAVFFDAKQFGVAPGQLAVFYDGEEVIGSAWITGAVA